MLSINLKLLKIICYFCLITGIPLFVMGWGLGFMSSNGGHGYMLHSGYLPEKILGWLLVAGGPVLLVMFFVLSSLYKKLGGKLGN